jgi:hypothetical protein
VRVVVVVDGRGGQRSLNVAHIHLALWWWFLLFFREGQWRESLYLLSPPQRHHCTPPTHTASPLLFCFCDTRRVTGPSPHFCFCFSFLLLFLALLPNNRLPPPLHAHPQKGDGLRGCCWWWSSGFGCVAGCCFFFFSARVCARANRVNERVG